MQRASRSCSQWGSLALKSLVTLCAHRGSAQKGGLLALGQTEPKEQGWEQRGHTCPGPPLKVSPKSESGVGPVHWVPPMGRQEPEVLSVGRGAGKDFLLVEGREPGQGRRKGIERRGRWEGTSVPGKVVVKGVGLGGATGLEREPGGD